MEYPDLKFLRNLSVKEQLLIAESYLPDAWELLHDTAKAELPKFDDNDEIVEEESRNGH